MGHIQKRLTKGGKAKYHVIIRKTGVQTSRIFSSLESARKWERETERAIERNDFLPQAQSVTLGRLIDKYISEALTLVASGEARPSQDRDGEPVFELKPKEAARGDQRRHLLWWKERLGQVPLARVTARLIRTHRGVLLDEPNSQGRQRSPATASRYVTSLSQALSTAVSIDWLERNPIHQKVKTQSLPRALSRSKLAKDSPDGDFVDDPNQIEYRIGSVFSAGRPERVKLLRLVIATRSVMVCARANLALEHANPEVHEQEDGTFWLLASVGAAFEAAKAFGSADDAGCFASLEDGSLSARLSEDNLSALIERLGRLRAEVDLDSEESLASQLLAFARNKAAYHWDHDEIRNVLAEAADESVRAFSFSPSGAHLEASYPIAAPVALSILRRRLDSQEEWDQLIQRVGEFQGDLFHVVDAAYTSALLEEEVLG